MTVLLKPLHLVNRVRRALYRSGVLRAKRLHRPVISIGNIAMGGTGKTPAVITVCRFLESRGFRVTVLTRGYGSDVSSDFIGDEPLLIKKSTNANVIVGKNRYQNARNIDTDVFVLDDGFQHLQLHRDLDVVIDAPARFFREGRSALRDADAVIPRRLELSVPEHLRGKPVFAFAGLADNEQFFDSLRRAGLDVIGTRGFRDHYRYSPADLDALRRDAAGAALVTTEKDAVKIDDPSITAIPATFVIDSQTLEQIAAVASSPPEQRGKRRKNALLQRIEYFAYRWVLARVRTASVEAVHRWGTRLGKLASIVVRRRTQVARRNLRIAFPERDERELRHIADASWQHFGREFLLSMRMQNLSPEAIAEQCPIAGAHHLEAAIAHGKGTLIASAHWGGWEIGALAALSIVGKTLNVARPLDNELLERDVQALREKTGAEVVDRRHAARALLKHLGRNGVVVLLPDQAVQPREGILVEFLGRPAWTTPAPARMALRTGASIVFAFCIPDGLRHRLEFHEPIRVDMLPESERTVEALTKRINDVLSQRIRERPDLYLWQHDRWKRAESESDVLNGV